MLTRFCILHADPCGRAAPALLPALAKVLVECAASAVVGINMLVDAFMAYRLLSISAHHASDCSGLSSSRRYASILPCIAGVNLIRLRLEKRRPSALRCACLCR